MSFSLLQLLTTDGCSLELQQHLNSIGITGDRTLPELIKLLRKLIVDEFLSCNSVEYSSFLLSVEHSSYEETAKRFDQDGFCDCELGNAVNLALANILRTSLVVFTSLENYPILTIIPKNDPVSNVPVYLAFEKIGPGHYDAVIQSGTSEELFDNTELLSETSFAETSQGKELTRPVCRCGQGAAKNKMTRKFCLEYKSGCKCYQNLKGCTSDCGCFNCANTFGVREESSCKSTSEIAIPRKRRKHGLGKETGRNFMIGRGKNVVRARWTLFEKLLCIECIANMENGDDDVDKLAEYYNNVVVCLKNGVLKCPKEFLTIVGLDTLETRESKSIEGFLKRLYDENDALKERMKQQVELNVL